MYQPNRPGRVEDYTDAFLTTLGFLLFMFLWFLGTLGGFTAVLLFAVLFDWLAMALARRVAR